jgi:hypothetical protein
MRSPRCSPAGSPAATVSATRGLRTALDIDGAEVSALTRRSDGRLVLRVVNHVRRPPRSGRPERTGERTDLTGAPTGEGFRNEVELRPWEIATFAIDD